MCIRLRISEATVASQPIHDRQPVRRPLPEREWLTLTEVVELGYGSHWTLRQRIKRGELAAAKIGNLIKVRREDLSALVVPIEPAEPTFADVEAAVERIVASAPPLTDEQCRRLASLFGGAA